MTTKEKIANEALTLFSQKGYNGTSVKDIAHAVGIKDSSLYKHYRSKNEIFSEIVLQMSNNMQELSIQVGLPLENNYEEAASYYKKLTLDGLITLSRVIFLFYLKDPFVSRFRRMATIEQYQSKEIYEVYQNIFMEASITYQTALFAEMIKQGAFIEVEPEILAMNFYTPIFFLICKYDQEPDKEEEALQILDKQIQEFSRIYRK